MTEELKQRHAKACDFVQEINHNKICFHLEQYRQALKLKSKPSKAFRSFKQLIEYSKENYFFDASYDSIIAIGAKDKNLSKEWDIFYPIFQAFEAGLWLFSLLEDGIAYIPIPRVYKNSAGQVHRANGPAIELPEDGRYYLNGVSVTKHLVMTPAEKLDPKMIFQEQNAEVRREIVRKIGMERIILKCGAKVLDKMDDYELLEFDIGDGRKRPYLKMRNPSIATWHIEGVPVGTKTVREALHFRKPPKLRAIPIDDEEGENWYEQGDVCVWPENAKSVKRYPAVLT